MKKTFIIALIFILILLLTSCRVNSLAGTTPDTSTPDTSTPDISTPDISAPDTSAADTSTPDTSASEPAEEPRLSKLELIASINVNEDIKYTDGIDCFIEGPTAYCIAENGDIYIVSAYERKIIEMNSKKSISLTEVEYSIDCVTKNGKIYVLDYSNQIYIYNINVGFINKYSLPDNIRSFDILHLNFTNNKLEFETLKKQKFSLNDNKFVEIENNETAVIKYDVFTANINNKTVTLDAKNKSMYYLGFDETGFYVFETEYNPYVMALTLETSLRKYDYNGNLIEYAIFDKSGSLTYPRQQVLFVNGELYFMKCTSETVSVYKVTLGNADVSHLFDIYNEENNEIENSKKK